MDDFNTFLESHKSEIAQVQAMLSKELSDNPTELNAELRAVEAQYARMVTIRAYSDSFLDLSIQEHLTDTSGTVQEREAKLNSLVVNERRFRDIMVGLTRAIEQRVSMGQSLLRAQEREMVR